MSDSNVACGQCLCGKVTIQTTLSAHVGACHCSTCRQWGGGPLLSLEAPAPVFSGDTYIRTFASSSWAERGFCSQCGSHLFYRLLAGGSYYLPAGLFNSQDLQLTQQIFVDENPGYYQLASPDRDTRNLTGAEVFALYNSE